MNKISVVVTAYNEEGRIEDLFRLVNQLGSLIPSIDEFVIVNNGSTDSTLSEIQHWINIFPDLNTRLIILEKNCGYGGGLKTGILISRYETVMLLPADGKYKSEDIHKVVAEYQTVNDIKLLVKGIRIQRNDPLKIQFLSQGLTFLCNVLFRTNLKDTNGLPKIFHKGLILNDVKELSSSGCFDATLCASWNKQNGKFKEIEVFFLQNNKASWQGKSVTFVALRIIIELCQFKLSRLRNKK